MFKFTLPIIFYIFLFSGCFSESFTNFEIPKDRGKGSLYIYRPHNPYGSAMPLIIYNTTLKSSIYIWNNSIKRKELPVGSYTLTTKTHKLNIWIGGSTITCVKFYVRNDDMFLSMLNGFAGGFGKDYNQYIIENVSNSTCENDLKFIAKN